MANVESQHLRRRYQCILHVKDARDLYLSIFYVFMKNIFLQLSMILFMICPFASYLWCFQFQLFIHMLVMYDICLFFLSMIHFQYSYLSYLFIFCYRKSPHASYPWYLSIWPLSTVSFFMCLLSVDMFPLRVRPWWTSTKMAPYWCLTEGQRWDRASTPKPCRSVTHRGDDSFLR